VSRVLKVCGLSESAVDEKIKDIFESLKNPSIALLATFSEIKIRITACSDSEKKAYFMISGVEEVIRNRLGSFIFGKDDETLEKVVANSLFKHNLTIAVAESCTGGLIANKLTNISGSSKYFERGIISYSNKSKIEILKVPEKLIKTFGAVSEKVSKSMAENIRKISKVDIGLSTTGIAGPTGATSQKPVGLVYISLSTIKDTITERHIFKGDREIIKERASIFALDLLRRYFINREK